MKEELCLEGALHRSMSEIGCMDDISSVGSRAVKHKRRPAGGLSCSEELRWLPIVRIMDCRNNWAVNWARCLLSTFALSLALSTAVADSIETGDALIGTTPPDWKVTHWIGTQPTELKRLRGKVVLVRWWTAPGCSYCEATAPALNEFYKQYGPQGLEVFGFYHHKSEAPLKIKDVQRYAQKLGFKFPIAIDPDWRTLKSWWLEKGHRDYTSATFLLDRKGAIRHIHPGGQYVKGDPAYRALKGKIEELLAEK